MAANRDIAAKAQKSAAEWARALARRKPAPRRDPLYREHVIERLLDAAERLMAELDDDASDADLEPALGALACLDQRYWNDGVADDREEVCEDEGAATGDDEPWLGTCPPYGCAFDGEVLSSTVEP